MKNLYIKENKIYIKPNCYDTDVVCINEIKNIINYSDSDICIDLCGFNMFTALHIATIISANELTKDLVNTIEILLDNEITLNYLKLFKLSNMNLSFLDNKKIIATV